MKLTYQGALPDVIVGDHDPTRIILRGDTVDFSEVTARSLLEAGGHWAPEWAPADARARAYLDDVAGMLAAQEIAEAFTAATLAAADEEARAALEAERVAFEAQQAEAEAYAAWLAEQDEQLRARFEKDRAKAAKTEDPPAV